VDIYKKKILSRKGHFSRIKKSSKMSVIKSGYGYWKMDILKI